MSYILEKRSGAQIQKASNVPDNEIIDTAKADLLPVKPNKQLIFALAIMAGICFPFLWFSIIDTFSKKVREDADIKKITSIPIIGHIPHSLLIKNTVVFDEPGSYTSEAFRSLRSRIQFFTRDTKSIVILITSSMQGEGKTFIAINLASVYSLLSKKTLIIDFDLRAPSIYNSLNISNDHGVSTWLSGKNDLNSIIKETAVSNLDVIVAGPIPPNPSELVALEKTSELLQLLKEKYDCIIIDSSPVGIFSDALNLSQLSDSTILVIKQNTTLKDQVENSLKELSFSDLKSTSIVINELGSEFKKYNYDKRNIKNY